MDEDWYSVRLLAKSEGDRDGLIHKYIAPLIEELDQIGEDFLFHFFRYGGRLDDPSPFLRLRISGSPTLREVVENWERNQAEGLDIEVVPEDYDTQSELGEGSPFASEEEVLKAWRIYDMASRLAVAVAQNHFPMQRLRDGNYGIVVKLNHLFLNSLGLHVFDEGNAHLSCVLDRSIIMLTRGGQLTQGQVWEKYEKELLGIKERLSQIAEIMNEALSRDAKPR